MMFEVKLRNGETMQVKGNNAVAVALLFVDMQYAIVSINPVI